MPINNLKSDFFIKNYTSNNYLQYLSTYRQETLSTKIN